VDGSAKSHSLQSPFEYDERCGKQEYEEVRESASALLSVPLRDLRASVRGFFRYVAAEKCLTALPKGAALTWRLFRAALAGNAVKDSMPANIRKILSRSHGDHGGNFFLAKTPRRREGARSGRRHSL
jgi:hypothetical protein